MFGIGKKKDEAEAAPVQESVAPAEAAPAVDLQPAGFWLRFVALILDYGVLLVLLAVMFTAADTLGGGDLAGPVYWLWVAITFFYWPVLESTARRGTVGKMALGLVVGDIDGGGLGFVRSLLRNLAKIISSIPLGIGFLLAAFTARKQALHDLITKAVVMRRGPGSLVRAIGVLVAGIALIIVGNLLTADQMMGAVMKEMEAMMGGGVAQPPAKPPAKPAAIAKPAAPAPSAPPGATVKPAPAPTPVVSTPAPQAPAAKPAPTPTQVAAAPAAKPAAAPAAKPAAAAEPKPAAAPSAAAKPAAAPAAKPAPEPVKVAASEPEPAQAKPAAAPATAPLVPLARAGIAAQPGPRFNDIMTAVLYRDRDTVSQLVALGRWVDKRDSNGLTPLMVAAGNGDAEMVQLLLQIGADPQLQAPGGATALDFALERGDAPTTQLLQRRPSR
jgi:uncharacterized RDD family membrane protein YckC